MHSIPCAVMNCILYTCMIADWLKTSAVLRSCAYESSNTHNMVFKFDAHRSLINVAKCLTKSEHE